MNPNLLVNPIPFCAKAGIIAAIGAFAASQSAAGTLTVTSLSDSGSGTLRDQVAASLPGDTIQFAVSGTIVLSSHIDISHTLSVLGPGPADLVVDANSVDRAFTTAGNPVVLSGMTIQRGLIMATVGADAVFCQNGAPGGDANGGAILDTGSSIILSNCWFRGNVTVGGTGGRGGNDFVGICYKPGNGGKGGDANGGAYFSATSLATFMGCTFSDNYALGGQGGRGGDSTTGFTAAGTGGEGGAGVGGAVYDYIFSGATTFTNCTFSGNSCFGGNGGDGGNNDGLLNPGGQGGNGGGGIGGAIKCFAGKLISSTVVSNSAFAGTGGVGGSGSLPGGGGSPGLEVAGGVSAYTLVCGFVIGNTILAENSASTFPNAYAAFEDLGYNYFGTPDLGCPFDSTSRVGTTASPLHPLLGPLAQNGGGLPTHAPLPGSPVVDWGKSFGLSMDERGARRPVGSPAISGGDGSDIGAFEFGSVALAIHSEDNGSNGTITITWPGSYGDFTLQSTSDLFLPNSWQEVNAVTPIRNQFVFTSTPSSANRFFRLIHR